VTHWQHPRFHAYFPSGNSFPSILGDMLSDGIGAIGFSWVSGIHVHNVYHNVCRYVDHATYRPYVFLFPFNGKPHSRHFSQPHDIHGMNKIAIWNQDKFAFSWKMVQELLRPHCAKWNRLINSFAPIQMFSPLLIFRFSRLFRKPAPKVEQTIRCVEKKTRDCLAFSLQPDGVPFSCCVAPSTWNALVATANACFSTHGHSQMRPLYIKKNNSKTVSFVNVPEVTCVETQSTLNGIGQGRQQKSKGTRTTV